MFRESWRWNYLLAVLVCCLSIRSPILSWYQLERGNIFSVCKKEGCCHAQSCGWQPKWTKTDVFVSIHKDEQVFQVNAIFTEWKEEENKGVVLNSLKLTSYLNLEWYFTLSIPKNMIKSLSVYVLWSRLCSIRVYFLTQFWTLLWCSFSKCDIGLCRLYNLMDSINNHNLSSGMLNN